MRITILLFFYYYLNQIYILENQHINISNLTKSFIISNWDEENIQTFQLGFYLKMDIFVNDFILISITDYKEFNINFQIKTNQFKIYLNNLDTNLRLLDFSFVYIKAQLQNKKLNVNIIINEKHNNFNFLSNSNILNNFNNISIILGDDKNLQNFKFKGRIMYLTSIVNKYTDDFENLKNIYSNVLVYHNFKYNIKNSNYFYNVVNNGFIGSINGDSLEFNKYKIFIKENILAGGDIMISTYFKPFNSYIKWSTDFIKYTNLFYKKAYSVYLSAKLDFYFFDDKNLINYDFAFYKRNDLEFINNITRFIDLNSFEYNIKSSFGIWLKNGISNNITYFKMVLIKIININDDNYKITYIYKTNKPNTIDYHNINIDKNETHIFKETDKHYIGVFNVIDFLTNGIKIYIFEVALILGTSFYKKNQNLYTKLEDNEFIWSCNTPTLIKNRTLNYNTCEHDDFIINNPIDGCLLYKNSICYKCISKKKLNNNNNCINKTNISLNFEEDYLENLILFKNVKNNTKLKNHEFSFDYGNTYKKYIFDCNIKIFKERYIYLDIKLNDKIIKLYSISQTTIVNNINLIFDFYLKNINKISIFKIDNAYKYTTYECNIYSSDYKINSKNLIPFEKCNYLINDNYLLKITEFMLFECFNKNNSMENYYLNNDYNIILKCNKNCKRCNSAFECLECIDNYFLLNNICLKNKNKNCLIVKDHSRCLVCANNSKFYKLNNDLYNCFSNCFIGCNSCDSPLFNECTSCKKNYLFYPELKQCLFSGSYNNCNNNYKKNTIGFDMCISNCKLKNTKNKCISCYKLLNLNISINECINCNTKFGYLKNSNILDSENRETCERCSNTCKTCELNIDKCTSCYNNKLLMIDLLKCVDICPKSYYIIGNKCIKCNNHCLECDNNNDNCLICSENRLIKYNECVTNCGVGYFQKDKKCFKCPKNCENCQNNEKCNSCKNNYYLDKNKICLKCNLTNNIIIDNKCLKCSNNCKTCNKRANKCTSCYNNYKLNTSNNICLKKCNKNEFFDTKFNNCRLCKLCKICYENGIEQCWNCEICNNKCKINIVLKTDYIQIKSLENLKIIFNKNYKINNLIHYTKLLENEIKFYFKNKYNKNSMNLLLDNNLFLKTTNCLNLDKYDYKLIKEKEKCKLNLVKIENINHKWQYKITTNFILNDNYEFNIKIKEINRIIYYKILKKTIINNKTIIDIQWQPNYFKPSFSFIFIILEEHINNSSNCIISNIKNITYVPFYKTDKFKTDYEINKDIILMGKDLKIIQNINDVSTKFKNTSKNSSIVLILVNVFNSGNIILFLSIIQLVYIFEFIILLPINLGDITNNFIYYFKLDLDLEININNYLDIQNKKITKFYENKFINNPKISNIRWINIAFIEIDIIIIISLNLIRLFFEIIKSFYKKSLLIKKLIWNIKILIFKFTETFKPMIMAIIIVYFVNINNFQMNFDDIKIIIILLIYYFIFNKYLWDIINSLIVIGDMENLVNKNKIEYYKEILFFKSESVDKYSLYQLFYLIKEFFFVIVIFILRSIKIHAFIFFFIQFIFVIYVLTLDEEKSYFKIQKIKFEEIINLILIGSLILNYYFKLEQFQLCFIIFYVLILSINLWILIFNMMKMFLKFIINIFKSKKILNKFKNN